MKNSFLSAKSYCLINLFIYLFLGVLGLRFCARAFCSSGERGPLFIVVRGSLTVAASPLRSTGSRCAGSVVVAHRPSRSAACGIFPGQGSNPCILHRQADSQPLRHQGSPSLIVLKSILSDMNMATSALFWDSFCIVTFPHFPPSIFPIFLNLRNLL